jgi:hypothetical protein
MMSFLLSSLLAIAATPAPAAPLEPAGVMPMPGVKGRIDHFSVDVAGKRLFVAALGNDTVEVFDLEANRHSKSLRGFGEPQGVLYVPATRRLFVANATANRVDVLDSESLTALRRIEPLPDADNVRLSPDGRVVVGYGKGALRFLDAASGEPSTEVRLAGHPESFQLERNGSRTYVNVPSAGHIAVIDRDTVATTWNVTDARAHFPMALDEAGKRLFVGARSPALMLVYDTGSGQLKAKVPICGDTDDLFFDAERKRVYVICGEGKVEVFSDGLSPQLTLQTSRGARTGLFVREYARLYVAAPANGAAPARILIFQVTNP